MGRGEGGRTIGGKGVDEVGDRDRWMIKGREKIEG